MSDYSLGKIYKITSSRTNKVYVGSTTRELKDRFREHKNDYKRYLNDKFHFISSFEIMIFQDCKIELIENCSTKNELQNREDYWIKKEKSVNKFNSRKFDSKEQIHCECGSIIGRHHFSRHTRTLKHKKYVKEQESLSESEESCSSTSGSESDSSESESEESCSSTSGSESDSNDSSNDSDSSDE